MENTRPTHHITLPLKQGELIKATIKTPVLRIKRQVQELTVRSIALSEECLELFKRTKPANEALAGAHGTAAEKKYREDRDALLARINSLNKEQFDIEMAQLKLVVNIPNNDAGAKRSDSVIDWEEIPEDEIKDAINFFVSGPKS
jgi:hypothetical protein